MITENINTLRVKSLDFDGTPEELSDIVKVLEFELQHAHTKGGVGLSGIQINIPYRVAIIRNGALKLNLYNAKITDKQQPYKFEGEACLSLPGQSCDTTRFNMVTVLNGDGTETKHSGFDAVIVQHEIGHWDGELFTDHKIEEK